MKARIHLSGTEERFSWEIQRVPNTGAPSIGRQDQEEFRVRLGNNYLKKKETKIISDANDEHLTNSC